MSHTLDHTPPPTGRSDVLFRRVGDDWLLFDPDAQEVHVLNLTAALVWAHCDGKHGVDEIEAVVAEAYPELSVTETVNEALTRFQGLSLLEG